MAERFANLAHRPGRAAFRNNIDAWFPLRLEHNRQRGRQAVYRSDSPFWENQRDAIGFASQSTGQICLDDGKI
jgi:hypothetical protein